MFRRDMLTTMVYTLETDKGAQAHANQKKTKVMT